MKLKERLDYHYKAFDKESISPDPLQFLHYFSDSGNIEAMGILAAVFAYGNVNQIINTLNRILEITGYAPLTYIKNYSGEPLNIKHRFYTPEDINVLFTLLNKAYSEFGTLGELFSKYYRPDDLNLKSAVSQFSNHLLSYVNSDISKISRGVRFMFPDPESGSACKRTNLFLRWMVRKDELDFGLWNFIPPHKLVIPVDTHIARICTQLKLTTLKNVSWKMAEQITENLKKFDPYDPVKYDFAICHIGMRKLKF